jgi:hypothetical protein
MSPSGCREEPGSAATTGERGSPSALHSQPDGYALHQKPGRHRQAITTNEAAIAATGHDSQRNRRGTTFGPLNCHSIVDLQPELLRARAAEESQALGFVGARLGSSGKSAPPLPTLSGSHYRILCVEVPLPAPWTLVLHQQESESYPGFRCNSSCSPLSGHRGSFLFDQDNPQLGTRPPQA